jgi:hypothetical protein
MCCSGTYAIFRELEGAAFVEPKTGDGLLSMGGIWLGAKFPVIQD